MDKTKISIAVCVWGTEHLFKRSIETYAKQDLKPSEWKLIVVDDNALGDVQSIIKPYKNDIQIEYIRFEHNRGMRGNVIGLNTAWMGATSPIIAESTPETMWQPNLVRTLAELHDGYEKRFVSMKTWNFTSELQMKIDTVDWRSDVNNLQKIDGFRNDWTTQHESKTNFRTHQTCSIRKKTMYEITNNFLLPLYGDYGCLEGKTKVLKTNLEWVRNDELKIGDELLGFTENVEGKEKRRFEKSIVLNIGKVYLPSYRIKTFDGQEIIASENHLWLGYNNNSKISWIRTDELKVGSAIKKATHKWNVENTREEGWLGGMIDGDGSIDKKSKRVAIIQNPNEIQERVCKIYDKWGVRYTIKKRYGNKGEWGNTRRGNVSDIRTSGTVDSMMVIGKANPLKGKDMFVGGMLPLGSLSGEMQSIVKSIEFIGVQELIGMTTSTKTFIAEGLCSHNSDDPKYSSFRENNGVTDHLVMDFMPYHQWHLPFNYFASLGHAPLLNKNNHTTSNYMYDCSGEIPENGTSGIWDGGNADPLSEEEKSEWRKWDSVFLETGGDERYLKPKQ